MVYRNLTIVFLLLTFVFLFHFTLAGELFEYVNPKSCDDQEYFSITQLQCMQCDTEDYLRPNENRLSCECEENSIILSSIGDFPKCRPCPPKHRPSLNKKNCIPCMHNSSDDEVCEYCAANEIQVDKEFNGNWLAVSKCIECSPDTVPSPDQSTCVPCPFEVPFDGDDDDVFAFNCSCPTDTHELLQHGTSRLLCIPQKGLSEWPDEVSSYTIKYESGSLISRYLQVNLRASAYLCLVQSDEKACQELANMCALTGFHMVSSNVVDIRRRIFGTQKTAIAPSPCNPFQPTSASSDQLPWIFYGEGEASAAMSRKKITAQYGMGSNARNTWLNLTAARYAPDGSFLGIGPIPLSKMSLCPEAAFIDNKDFFRFGAPNSLSCELSLRAIMNQTTEFMDLFLSYRDGNEGSSTMLYALPILSLNVQLDGNEVNKGNEESQWQLVRRMFLFDAMSGTSVGSETLASVVQYLKYCHIRIRLRGREEEGLIYPPLIKVQYGIVTLENENTDQTITATISVDYEQPDGFLMKPVEVWSGILGAVAVLIAFLQSWSSIRRDSITLPSSAAAPIWFVRSLCLHAAGRLADAALIIASAASIRTLVLYKGQSVPHITLPVVSSDSVLSGGVPEEDALIKTYVIIAFSLKCIEILHMLVSQSSVDIFFLDWERPRPLGTSHCSGLGSSGRRPLGPSGDMSPAPHPVSAWRMCFVANEWNELQATRRTSTLFQILIALFCLKVLGLENWAATHPDLTIQLPALLKDSPPSLICHVAVGVIIYSAIYLCQIIFVVVYEHYGKNSIQEFVDLCSMANVSVLIFPWLYFGFYVHGRSAHGFADTDLASLKECLRRESEDACGSRGLVPDGMERQTFRIAVPPAFRTCYDRLLSITLSSAANISSTVMGGSYPTTRRPSPSGIWGARSAGNGMASPGPSSGLAEGSDQTACQGMNKFLSAFLDHALKDIDYEVRDKLFIETLLDMELTEPMDYGIFYNDNGHSFDQVLLYGNELTLAAFNLLTFMFVDVIFLDYILAAIITVFIDKIVIWVRRVTGRRNLSRKSLIDERFLI